MNDTLSAETVRYAEECAFKCLEDRFCVGYNYNSRVTDYETVNCLLNDQFLENTVPFKKHWLGVLSIFGNSKYTLIYFAFACILWNVHG